MSHLQKMAAILGVAVILAPALSADAYTVPSSAAKAYRYRHQRRASTSYVARPVSTNSGLLTTTEAYRSFSYQPAAFEVGQEVLVKADGAKLMRGNQSLAELGSGQQLKVLKIEGSWIGVEIEQDGQKVNGWVQQSRLRTNGVLPSSACIRAHGATD